MSRGRVAHLDDTDRAIINAVQGDFPLSERPYLEVATRPFPKSHTITGANMP